MTMNNNYTDNGVVSSRPHFNMSNAVKAFFKNYAKFDGRASRSEYWWTYLAYTILSLILVTPLFTMGLDIKDVVGDNSATINLNSTGWVIFGVLVAIGLAIIIPNISLTIRRLHDAGYSGWLYLVTFIPWVGSVILLVLCAMKSNPAGQRFDGPTQPWLPEEYKPTLPVNTYNNMNDSHNLYMDSNSGQMPYPNNDVVSNNESNTTSFDNYPYGK